MFRAKYGYLLEDEDVRRWFDNLAAKSILTATVYLRNLGLYCELNDTDPKGILRDAGSKAFRDRFADFVRRLEREPPDMIEDMRRAYRECEPFLCTVCAQVVSFKMLSSRLHY